MVAIEEPSRALGVCPDGWVRVAPWMPTCGRGTGIEDAVTHQATRVVATLSATGRLVVMRDGDDGREVELAPHLVSALAWPTLHAVAEWWRMELQVRGHSS